MEIDIKQFYELHIKKLDLKEQLELLELLMQSTLESIREEKNYSRIEEATALQKIEKKSPDAPAGLTDFQKRLLNGPLMSEEDYALFKEKKEHFAQWK